MILMNHYHVLQCVSVHLCNITSVVGRKDQFMFANLELSQTVAFLTECLAKICRDVSNNKLHGTIPLDFRNMNKLVFL